MFSENLDGKFIYTIPMIIWSCHMHLNTMKMFWVFNVRFLINQITYKVEVI